LPTSNQFWRPLGRLKENSHEGCQIVGYGGQLAFNDVPTPTIAPDDIDYREAEFEKVRREKVDVVFDLIGGDTQKPLTNARATHSDQA
jgi:hypothetical protein